MKRWQGVFVLVVMNVLLLLLCETVVRGLVAVSSRSPMALAWGVDRDLRLGFAERRITAPRVYHAAGSEEVASRRPVPVASTTGTHAAVLTLGGSSVEGFACSRAASSWPLELGRISPGLVVTNRGLSGTNSDEMLHQLYIQLAAGVPDVVLWSEWINEMDVAFVGLGRNRDRIQVMRPDLAALAPGGMARASHTWRRVSETAAQLSLGYAWFREGVLRLGQRTAAEQESGPVNPGLADLAVLNYQLNLEEALRLSERNGFRLVIVRLPINWRIFRESLGDRITTFAQRWDSLMVRTAMAHVPAANFIDVQAAYDSIERGDEYFCDQVHQTLPGHTATAVIVKRQLWPSVR